MKNKKTTKLIPDGKIFLANIFAAFLILLSEMFLFMEDIETAPITLILLTTLQWILLILAAEGLLFFMLSVIFLAGKRKKLAKGLFFRGLMVIIISLTGYVVTTFFSRIIAGKPVIYLYPTEKTAVQVQLDFDGEIIADYPAYDEVIGGWEVEAYPDGHLINKADRKEYSYLFWEGEFNTKIKWNFEEGYVVKGEDTREFLQQILSQIGLTPREYNEFIVYWYPLMKDNPYNLIHFANEKYTDHAKLKIDPMPDSILRVFMVYRPLNKRIEIRPQKIEHFERKGFTVVEWGGTKVR